MEMEHREASTNHGAKAPLDMRVLLAVAATAAVAAFGGLYMANKVMNHPPAPATASALATARLYTDAQELKRLIDLPTDKSASGTEYVQISEDFSRQCARVPGELDKNTVPADVRDSVVELHRNSVATCKNLVPLTESYTALYGPMLPILDIDTTPRRYETLPLFKQRLQGKHAAVIATAAAGPSYTAPDEFASAAHALLPALSKAIKSSKNLDYLPRIREMQVQLSGEQKLFWQSYGGLEDLERYLAGQTDGYCTYLPKAGIPDAVCQQADKVVD